MSRAALQPDPLCQGARVRVIAGEHAGKQGTIQRAYRGRPCGLDRIYVELDGGPIGWSVALKVEELEPVR
ncbi:MAG: 50S ribosomal protein L24 [Hyphomicrobiales bacterium]|nr:MAG: 50S ribosomal protein L24 [Hyphomicrobiales bacterium]